MCPFDSASSPSPFMVVNEPLASTTRADAALPSLLPLLFDFADERASRHVQKTLEWVAEAQQVIAAQQERIAYLESLTMTDELTGLLNRRGFFSHFGRELAHAERDAAAGGMVIMIDLDGFKAINDSLGHEAGDAMLRRIAALLGHQVRAQDVVARLGGDEFVILLSGVTPQAGQARAEAIATNLNGESVTWRGHTLPVAFSFGVASFGPGDCEETVLRRADAAMYANKGARRRPGQRLRQVAGTTH